MFHSQFTGSKRCAAIIAAGLSLLLAACSHAPKPDATPTPTATPEPTTASPSPTATTPSPTPSASIASPTPSAMASKSPEWNPTLGQAVAEESCGHAYDWESLSRSDDVSAIAQKTYNNGSKCHMEYTLDGGSVEFLVPKDAKTFTITAGQSDYSRDTNITVTFEISDPISDKVLDTASLRLNEAKEFSIDVSSVPRLKLKVVAEAAQGESRKSDISITVIWADPKFS